MCILAHGEPPLENSFATHSCGNGDEGCVNPQHLRWGTHQTNMDDMRLHGTTPMGERNGFAKLSENDVRSIRALSGKMKQRDIGELFGIKQPYVSQILSGKTWSHIL